MIFDRIDNNTESDCYIVETGNSIDAIFNLLHGPNE